LQQKQIITIKIDIIFPDSTNIKMHPDSNYRDMLDRIDASIPMNGETQYAPFVKALNIRAEHYSDITVQRKGRAAKKKVDSKES
jgi:hypothetical protein